MFWEVLLLALFDHLLNGLGFMRAQYVPETLVATKHGVFELAFVDDLELARRQARIVNVLITAHGAGLAAVLRIRLELAEMLPFLSHFG